MSNIPSDVSNTPLAQQLVSIVSVDPANQKAIGRTRQQSYIYIDIRYPVGAVHVVPYVGQQWVCKKVGINWALDRLLPKNTNIHANILDNPTQGMVQIGTSGLGSGPILLEGSVISILAPLQLQAYSTNNLPSPSGAGVGAIAFDLTRDQVVYCNGTAWNPITAAEGVTSTGRVTGETPIGTVNGSNAVFTTTYDFIVGTTAVYRNGLRESYYTETAPNTLTFSSAPLSSDKIEVDYAVQASN